MKYTREIGERAYREHRVNKRSVYDVAQELGTSPPNVTRWSQRYERENPATINAPGSGFLDRLRAEVAGDDESIPGFEVEPDEDDDGEEDDDAADDGKQDNAADLRQSIRELKKLFSSETDPQTKARYAAIRAQMMNTLVRIEKQEAAKAGLITMSIADIEQAIKDVEAKALEVAEREDHSRCVDCGRAFRMRRAIAAVESGRK